MRSIITVLAVLCTTVFAAGVIDLDPVNRADEWLSYDDGSPSWYAWEGIYKGVWFNLEDFVPGWSGGVSLTKTEIWFFHDSGHPWDISDFYCEMWNGDASAPVAQLDQVLLTAVHYAPVYAVYTTPVSVENNFWALANTELSSGGWPSIISDGAGSAVAHSFFTNNFVTWEPWEPSTGLSNYFIAVLPEPWSLNSTTWGALKAVF